MLDLSDELIECQKEPFDCTSSLERISLFMFFMKVGRNIETKRNFDDFKEWFRNGVIRGLSEL